MRRILTLIGVLLCAVPVFASRAEAQCNEKCTASMGVDGKINGWGCIIEPDSHNRCRATVGGCNYETCSGVGVILDSRGAALASAELCGGRVGEVRSIAVVPAEAVPTAGASRPTHAKKADRPRPASTLASPRAG